MSIDRPISVMVVDDSAFMRKILSDLINSSKDLKVVATSHNGKDAIVKIPIVKPDVITLDIIMPEMDGIETLKYIMAHFPTPVIMVSSLTDDNSKETTEALILGAVDFVHKPSGSISLDMYKKKEQLIEKIKAAAKSNLQIYKEDLKKGKVNKVKITKNYIKNEIESIIGIGISTGGPRALLNMIPLFPENIGAPILISQHMPERFTKSFAERLDEVSTIKVKEAEDGEELKNDIVYIAKGNHHLLLKRKDNDGKYILRTPKEPETIYKPSVDLMFESIAKNFSGNIIGIIMTGMGNDGSKGLVYVKEKGGYIIAQNEETCVVFGMPSSAIKEGIVDIVIPYMSIPEIVLKRLKTFN